MNFETVRMSSKGQIVIPQRIRDELRVQEGSVFVVIGDKNSVVLRKIETPSKKDLISSLENIAKEGRKRAERKGIKESDVSALVHKNRKERR